MTRLLSLAAAALVLPAAVFAQDPQGPATTGGAADRAAAAAAAPAPDAAAPVLPTRVQDTRLRVFLDCQNTGCDRNFFVQELPFALWTQDRLDADVHLLITRLGTAAGGGEYTLTFNGQRRFGSHVDTLVTQLPPNTTDDMRRRELTRVAKIGLAPFAMRLPGAERFSVQYVVPANAPAAPAMSSLRDPWDFWVFRLRANGSGNAESRSSSFDVNGGFNASRITEAWKFTFNAQNEYRANRFELSDSTERRFVLRSADVTTRLVRSIDAHWSAGVKLNGGFSEFRNTEASAAVDLSLEYNVFPWTEATSRQFVAILDVGTRYFDYYEESIFGLGSEHRPVARAVLAGESRQTWGSLDGALRYTRFLHDDDTYSINFFGRTNFRLTRGLSLELRGDASKVNDQLYLPRGEATDDEVLTRQRALATAYRLSGSVGLTFTFGSIYNSIVNPRLDDLGQ